MGRKRKSTWHKTDQSYRRASMPVWFDDAAWGICRWCNRKILKDTGEVNSRRRWHPDCLHEYLIITDARYAKRQVKKRDKGICVDCGIKCRLRYEWQMDHIVALADIPDKDLKWWKLENLCSRCVKCHQIKSSAENLARRLKKRFKAG
jgi:5-methylcytosine-specific restriction endonuclease McrA